ncbi:MAG: flagellar assembly protein FliH [Gammaproteobacteria bacterium]|nr:flagellar assembly protein FliH [Gammaproteobacteria bacterium]
MSIPSVKPLPRTSVAQRWQAPAVDTAEPERPADDGRDRLLTAERLAEIEEQARAEGYRAGFDEGRAAGREAGLDEMRAQAERLAALVDGMTPQLRVLDEALLAELSELVLAVARQFVRRELRSQPGEVVRVVREALTALPASDARVRVYLNAEDAALVRQALAPESLERPLQILEDIALARGGARLETDTSVVDASVETRIATLAARLLGDDRRAAHPVAAAPHGAVAAGAASGPPPAGTVPGPPSAGTVPGPPPAGSPEALPAGAEGAADDA